MRSIFVNQLIIGLARKMDCSPLVAHIGIMVLVTIGAGLCGAPVFHPIWLGTCAAVVVVTWTTKGEYRRDWLKAEPWRKAQAPEPQQSSLVELTIHCDMENVSASKSLLHSQKIGPITTPEERRLVAAYEAAIREKRNRRE